MKKRLSNFSIVIVFLVFSCNHTTENSDNNRVSESGDLNKITQDQPPNDSLAAYCNKLYKMRIIDSKQPCSILNTLKLNVNNSSAVTLIRLKNDDGSIPPGDPILAYLVAERKDSIVSFRLIGTSDENDLTYYSGNPPLFIFQYYSSTVGYVEYIAYNATSNKWYKSKQFDETQSLDSTGIDAEKLTFKTLSEGKSNNSFNTFIPWL